MLLIFLKIKTGFSLNFESYRTNGGTMLSGGLFFKNLAVLGRRSFSFEMAPLLVFDFDHTVVNQNTDIEVQKLAPGGKIPQEIRRLWSPKGWTRFMSEVFKHLHSHRVTKTQILNSMKDLTLTPGLENLIKTSVRDHRAEVVIISDSNSVFIDDILRNTGLDRYISKVYTNPAWFDSDELLILEPYHHQETCQLSSVNLCKGRVMEEHIASTKKDYTFIAYVGDGSNDFCPMLRLGTGDLAFPRKDHSIEKHISKMKMEKSIEIKAEIHLWNNGDDILETFIKKIAS